MIILKNKEVQQVSSLLSLCYFLVLETWIYHWRKCNISNINIFGSDIEICTRDSSICRIKETILSLWPPGLHIKTLSQKSLIFIYQFLNISITFISILIWGISRSLKIVHWLLLFMWEIFTQPDFMNTLNMYINSPYSN